ncbi:MAG TPA: hypothetical protein V6D47_22360 [Oscillatoriaceae cyanobacterium]
MPTPRFQYQLQDTPQTVREARQEYLDGHPGLFPEDDMPAESRAMFHRHDLCHVIFGLDTVPRDEARADLWTMMGTDVGWGRYMAYLNLPEAKAAFKTVSPWQMAVISVFAVPDFFGVWACTRRMPRKLSWDDLDAHLDTPLADLRTTYGIRLLDQHAPTASRV